MYSVCTDGKKYSIQSLWKDPGQKRWDGKHQCLLLTKFEVTKLYIFDQELTPPPLIYGPGTKHVGHE